MNFDSMNINLLDAGFGIVLLLFFVRGLLRGMVHEIAGLVGIFLGFFLAGKFYVKLVPQFSGIVTDPRLATALAYGAIFAAALVLVAIGASIVRKFMAFTFTAWVDYLLGAVVGGAKGVLICAVGLAILGRFVPDSPFLTNSHLAKYIDAVTVFARSLLPAFL